MSRSPVCNLEDMDVMLTSVRSGKMLGLSRQCTICRIGMSRSPLYDLKDLDVTLDNIQYGQCTV